MDSQANPLGKLLPKSIAAKRRRKRGSTSETQSLDDDASQRSRYGGNGGSDANSFTGSMNSSATDPVADELGPELNKRPTAISGSSTSTTPSFAARIPDPPPKKAAPSHTLPRESSDSHDSARSVARSRTSLGPPELRRKRSTSSSRLRDAFKLRRDPDESQTKPQPAPQTGDRPPPGARSRASSRPQKLELKPPPPRTPPPSDDAQTPVIVNTPPTPPETHRDSATAGPRRPPDAVPSGSMMAQRRRSGSNAGPSKLSTISAPPLTPTPENAPASPNPAATFFSSMFSAVQSTATSLSTNIPTLGQTQAKSARPPPKERADGARDAVDVEPAAPQRQPADPKEPAVKTLGMGDLSLSQLGIADPPSAAPSPVVSRFAETETRARSESAPTEPRIAVIADALEDAGAARPRSALEPAGGERTPPAGSVYEDKTGVARTGSIGSTVAPRGRNRGSSIATHVTAATSIAGAAGGSSATQGPGGPAPRLTGFAVANKKRNRDFHALFKSVPDDDYLIEDYSCALQREILAHGRLYISEGHLCFSSNILGWITTLVMSFDEIVAVEKRSTALVFKNGLEISTLHAKHIFASFASRDTTYDLIIKIWRLSHPHLQSSLNGVRLEEPGGDRTEKVVDAESASAAGTHSMSGSDESGDDGDDDVYDEDEDDDDDTQPAGAASDSHVSDFAEKAAPRKVSGAAAPPDKLDDGGPPGAADFPGPAAHAPTDCGDAASHFERVLGDDVIPAPLGKVYNMVFGPASAAWMGRWLTADQKCFDLQMEDKRGLTDEVRTRNYTYIKPLSASIGPKQTKCIVTEQLENIDLEKAVNVLVTTQNPDVPNGNIFVVKTKYCLTWAENNGTRIQINNLIEWSGKSWLKGAIERGANDGQAQYCKDLFAGLKAAVSSRARPGALNGAARAKKRGRKRQSALASGTASDAEGAAKASARQSWGLFEPARPLLGPVADTIRPILTGNVVYGLLVGLLVASWFGFGARPGPHMPRYSPDPAYADAPQRLAAYDELWRAEESDLWAWIEERAGLDRLAGAGPHPPPTHRRSVDPRTVEEKLREERMDDRELREAIRVTEEHLDVLKSVVDRQGAGAVLGR